MRLAASVLVCFEWNETDDELETGVNGRAFKCMFSCCGCSGGRPHRVAPNRCWDRPGGRETVGTAKRVDPT